MTEGNDAEIHGYPLKRKKSYTITEGGVGIHSWRGCKIEVSGSFDDKPPMIIHDDIKDNNGNIDNETAIYQYLKAHSMFRKERALLAKATNKDFKCIDYDEIMTKWSDFDIQRNFTSNLDKMGPRILILGDTDTGKSTLCKLLINWAQRKKDEPIFIDLDCGQNSISIPGTLCGDVIKDYHIPWRGYQFTENDDTNNFSRNPFIYYFGNTSPGHSIDLYKHYVSIISMTMKKKMLSSEKQRCGGSIINTCGWVQHQAFPTIKHIIHSFNINHIIILQYDQYQQLETWLKDEVIKDIKYEINIQSLVPTKGVKTREKEERKAKRDSMCRQYFHGEKVPKKLNNDDFMQSDPEYDQDLIDSQQSVSSIEQKKEESKINATESKKELKDKKQKKMDIVQFVDEFSPYERSYLFNEITFYEIEIKGDTNDRNQNNDNVYSYSSSSDREGNGNNNSNNHRRKPNTKHKGRGKKGGKNSHRFVEINCQYADGLEQNKFNIKSKRFEHGMIGHIVAVTHAQTPQELMRENIAGFLYIKDVDAEKKEIRVLQTCVGPLPGLCVIGKVQWGRNASNYNHNN